MTPGVSCTSEESKLRNRVTGWSRSTYLIIIILNDTKKKIKIFSLIYAVREIDKCLLFLLHALRPTV